MIDKKHGVVISVADYNYKRVAVADKSGKRRFSASNGDAIAKAMLLHISGGGAISKVVKDNKLESRDYANAGIERMSVGARLRAKVRHGETVKIGSIEVKSLKQVVALEIVKTSKPSKAASATKKAPLPRKAASRSVSAA